MKIYPTKYKLPMNGLKYLEYYGKHQTYHPGRDFNFGSGNDDYGQEIFACKHGFVEYVSPKPTVWNLKNPENYQLYKS